MTEDYKEKLIKYLTGNIEPEEGANEPQFIDKGLGTNKFYEHLNQQFTNGWEYRGEIYSQNNDYFLVYGNYTNDNTNYFGFIFIMDVDLNPIATITEYDSGTKFRPFALLDIDDEGYFYGLDQKNALYDTSVEKKDRFIMLNKIMQTGKITGNFIVKLRNSYYIPNDIQSQYANWGIIAKERLLKKVGAADYYFIADTETGLGVIGLTVNVGEASKWNFINTTVINGGSVISTFAQYDNEQNLSIIIGGEYRTNYYDYIEVKYMPGEIPTITTKNIIPRYEDGYISDILKLNSNTTYVGYSWSSEGYQNAAIYKVDYGKNQFIQIAKFTNIDVNYLGSYIIFSKINGLAFFKLNWDSKNQETQQLEGNSYIGLIIDKDLYYTATTNIPVTTNFLQEKLYINNVYNLYTLYSPASNGEIEKKQLVFNQNNYNGLPYEAPNCLVPNSGILYDTDDNIIFARNLYNKTVLGATTTSTVQIPNTMLNDTTIGKSALISETNLPLTEDETDITKNIYETVNINFANSISIRNDNDPNNRILNPTAAARLNGSTTQNNNYDDVKATKVRVNYTDGTNMIIKLNPTVQIGALTATVYQYNFILYVSKAINNLEIISNDELTIYQTIDNLTLEVGKTYNILQGVEVQ